MGQILPKVFGALSICDKYNLQCALTKRKVTATEATFFLKPKYPNVIPDCIGLRLRYKYIFLLFPYPNPQPLAIINFHDWLDFFCRLLANIFSDEYILSNTFDIVEKRSMHA